MVRLACSRSLRSRLLVSLSQAVMSSYVFRCSISSFSFFSKLAAEDPPSYAETELCSLLLKNGAEALF